MTRRRPRPAHQAGQDPPQRSNTTMMNARLIQQMQARMMKMQEELANQRVEASAGGGAVVVVATGQQKIESIKIAPEAIDPDDPTMLEDLVLAAVNEALEKSRELVAQQLSALTGGMKIPGLM
jgi:DNA-binding YbaB/EbfC family protein